MRHLKEKKITGRDRAHRKALIKNLCLSFFRYGKIKTTESKAKLIKPYIENIITIGKNDTLHNRRNIVSKIGDNALATKILKEISPKYKDRKGGYTRIIKLKTRHGDGSTEVYISLV